ncbi:MAG: hypothetical protein MRK00_09315 [Nitrosomonas sp.]|nr:hypothetical protein [Nitrosomonas sp.]
MGAIFFYIFIYFVSYYGSAVLNMFTVRPLITNRFMAALVPVVVVAIMHAYMIVTKPPPASQDVSVESAIFTYVIMPVIIVALGAVYFMWNTRKGEEEEAEEAARRAAEDAEDDDDEELDGEEKTAEKRKSSESDAANGNNDEIKETDKKDKDLSS